MTETRQVIAAIGKIFENFFNQLSNLDDEQLQSIIEGKAEFIGYRLKAPKSSSPSLAPTLTPSMMEQWKEKLFSCTSREEGVDYIGGLTPVGKKKITIDQIIEFAGFLNCGLKKGKNNRGKLITLLVQHTLGAKLNRDAIHQR